MKKLFVIICLLTLFIPGVALAKEKEKVAVYFFYGDGCPHCHKASEFFDNIQDEYGEYFELKKFETWDIFSQRRNKLMREVAEAFDVNDKNLGVPFIIIGDKTFIGYASNYDDDIIEAILDEYNNDDYEDLVIGFVNNMHIETYSRYGSVIILAVLLIVNVAIRNPRKKKEPVTEVNLNTPPLNEPIIEDKKSE